MHEAADTLMCLAYLDDMLEERHLRSLWPAHNQNDIIKVDYRVCLLMSFHVLGSCSS